MWRSHTHRYSLHDTSGKYLAGNFTIISTLDKHQHEEIMVNLSDAQFRLLYVHRGGTDC
jgi:hypothetical protein